VKLIRRAGLEVDAELHLGPTGAGITNVGGRAVMHTMPYSNLATAEYHESRHARVFIRTTRHWLLLKGAGGAGVLLRLERDAVTPIIGALEQFWGRKVQVLAPQQEPEPPPGEEKAPGAQ
jgi:hypothetical protein